MANVASYNIGMNTQPKKQYLDDLRNLDLRLLSQKNDVVCLQELGREFVPMIDNMMGEFGMFRVPIRQDCFGVCTYYHDSRVELINYSAPKVFELGSGRSRNWRNIVVATFAILRTGERWTVGNVHCIDGQGDRNIPSGSGGKAWKFKKQFLRRAIEKTDAIADKEGTLGSVVIGDTNLHRNMLEDAATPVPVNHSFAGAVRRDLCVWRKPVELQGMEERFVAWDVQHHSLEVQLIISPVANASAASRSAASLPPKRTLVSDCAAAASPSAAACGGDLPPTSPSSLPPESEVHSPTEEVPHVEEIYNRMIANEQTILQEVHSVHHPGAF